MDRSDYYRSKVSRHYQTISRRSLEQGSLRRNQKLHRLESFQQNRNIDVTLLATPPETPAKPADATGAGAAAERSAQKSARRLSYHSPAVQPPVLSKKQAFRQRFKEYMEQKKKAQEAKAKSKAKPFVSTVASGRVVEEMHRLDAKATAKGTDKGNQAAAKPPTEPVKPRSTGAIPKVKPQTEAKTRTNASAAKPSAFKAVAAPISSPINTRSRKLALAQALDTKPLRKAATENKPKPSTATQKALAKLQNQPKTRARAIAPALISGGRANASVLKTDAKKPTTTVAKKPTTTVAKKPATTVTKKPVTAAKPSASTPAPRSLAKDVQPAKPSTISLSVKNKNVKPTTVTPAAKVAKPPKPSATVDANAKTKATSSIAKTSQRNQTPKAAKAADDSIIIQAANVITSTVVKGKRPLSHTDEFEDSFSPINGTPGKGQAADCSTTRRKSFVALPPDDFKSPDVPTKPTSKILALSTPRAAVAATIEPNINYVSPFVTISRGRQTKRRESAARLSMCASDPVVAEAPTVAAAPPPPPPKHPQNVEAAKYFRNQLQQEMDRFNALMEKWQTLAAQPDNRENIPSEYHDLINVAVGQTRLLTTSKFLQFRNLIDEFEQKNSMRAEDLEGFWSMVYLQVDNCGLRFERLDTLMANDWIDPTLNVTKEKKIRPASITIAKAKVARPRPNTGVRAMIEFARQKVKEKEQQRQADALIMMTKKRRSSLANVHMNSPAARRSVKGTPKKSIWLVEDTAAPSTPVRSILKTPGSVRKQRMTLTIKKSPEVLLFNKENAIKSMRD